MKSTLLPTRILITLFSLLCFSAKGQLSLDWALSQGSKISDLTSSCHLDDDGNIYTVGVIRDTTDLDPGPDVDLLTPPDPEALVISKFANDGTYLWGNRMISNGVIGGAVTQLKDNELVLVIYFSDSLVYIRQGIAETIAKAPGAQIRLITMDTEGNVTWVHYFQDKQNMYFSNLETLDDGSFIAGGSFEDTLDLASSGGTLSVISEGGYDAFLARFDASFTLQWIKTISSPSDDYIEDLYTRDDETVYFTMVHDASIFLVTEEGIKNFPALGEDNNIYGIASLDDGAIQKTYAFGGDLGDQVRAIAADEEGNIYVCGYFEGDVNFQHPSAAPIVYSSVNGPDGFVAKYSVDGTLAWTRIITDTDYGGIYTMTLERGHELYLTGTAAEIVDFDPGPDTNIVDTGHRGYIYTAKFTTDGTMKWLHYFPGNDNGGFRNLIVRDTSIILHGYYYDTLDCDPSQENLTLVSQGGSDMFLMRFTEEGVITSTSSLHTLATGIYPNPIAEILHVECESPINEVVLYRMDGSSVYAHRQINQHTVEMNVRELPAGIYVVKVRSGDYFSTSKVVKL